MEGDKVTRVLLRYVSIETPKQVFSQTTGIRAVSEKFFIKNGV
jgi:hypothetical protein